MKLGTILTLAVMGLIVISGVIAGISKREIDITGKATIDQAVYNKLTTNGKAETLNQDIINEGTKVIEVEQYMLAKSEFQRAVNMIESMENIEMLEAGTEALKKIIE